MTKTKSFSRKSVKWVGLLLLLVCFFQERETHAGISLPAVGPRPHGDDDTSLNGYLIVYSSTEQTQWGDGPAYYPHSAYWIYNSEGKRVKTVANHISSIDETPEQVEITPGTYTIKAWSDQDGLVTVPVIIKPSRVTRVHLEDGRDSEKEIIDAKRAVYSPSGQIVGWKA